MEARRSKRTRNAPKTIYEVEDKRPDEDDEADAQSDEAMSSEGDDLEEHDDEEGDETFALLAPKKSATPRARKPRLRSVPEERAARSRQPKKNLQRDEEQSDEDDDSFFDAMTRKKPALNDLMTRWRERYEENNDQGTRELLNFILEACGGDNQLIGDTEALDKIDMNDMVQFVVEDLAKSNNGYPIASRFKSLKKFQGNFVQFWSAFVNECIESELLVSTDVVGNIVDWMTTLSSAEVRAIRHTTTVGVFAIGSALVGCARTITHQLTVVNRQVNADRVASKNAASKKSELLKENKQMFESRLRQATNIINLIFNGVLVHRFRDVMPEIRLESARALKQWVSELPDHFLKDSYLKYLGWMLNDKEASVRLASVNVLRHFYEIEEFTEKLELFNSRFFPRFLEMCDDADDYVVQACIQLLIAADKRGLVTTDNDLQAVEKLVFEPNSGSIRKAAAEFVCMQYDAFGVAESKKNSKLKKEQLETQAIALVEFAEENIRNHGIPVESVEILVDAFWNLDDCQVLHDWKLITNMLLADKSTPDLSSDQQSILMWLLVGSIRKIVCEQSDKANTPALKKQAARDKEEIAVSFCKEIPDLLIQYQSDAQKLFLVVELIPMLSLSSDVIGQHHGHIKDLLERLKHVFLNHSEEKLLASLSLAIRHLLQAEHETVKRDAEVVIHEIFQTVLDKIQSLLESDEKLVQESRDRGMDSSASRKTRSTKEREISDVEYALRVALCRLTCMIRHLNPREYFPSSILPTIDSVNSSTTSRMQMMGAALVELVYRRSKNIVALDAGFRHEDIVKNALMILYSDLLWVTSPIFKTTDAPIGSDSVSGIDSDKTKSAQDHIAAILHSRSCLEESLISVLEMHLQKIRSNSNEETKESEVMDDFIPEDMEDIPLEDEEIAKFVRDAQRCAFIIFCDTSCLFTEKLRDSPPPFNALDWSIPKSLLLLTQMYFDNEMEMEEPEPDQADSEQIGLMCNKSSDLKVQQLLKAELLVAIGKTSLCNPSNKGQAAAILQYFTDNGTPSVEVVKLFSKQVKTEAPIRYLEIQMTALRRLFGSILSMRDELSDIPPDSEEYDTICEELQQCIENTESELRDLARKFSQSLGVGKIAPSLRAPFFRFVCEGVRFSLEKHEYFGFLESLRPYLSHMEFSSTKQLRSYFEQQLQRFDQVPKQDDLLDSSWRYVFDFHSALTITKKGPKKSDQAEGVQSINLQIGTETAASSVKGSDNITQDQPRTAEQENDEYADHGEVPDFETEGVVMAGSIPTQTHSLNKISQQKMTEDESRTALESKQDHDQNSAEKLSDENAEETSYTDKTESPQKKMTTRSTRKPVDRVKQNSNSSKRKATTNVVERSKRQKTEKAEDLSQGNNEQDIERTDAAEEEIDSRRARRLRRAKL